MILAVSFESSGMNMEAIPWNDVDIMQREMLWDRERMETNL